MGDTLSRAENWKHFHLEVDGARLKERHQRYRAAWEMVARLAKTAPASRWRVFQCANPLCRRGARTPGPVHAIPAGAAADPERQEWMRRSPGRF